ncbi:MAG TPA: methylmalonyl-CoA epimerase [Pelolinea sp.]|nr:methylmalonyl-CoA epimerase [Pelolinea sp.]
MTKVKNIHHVAVVVGDIETARSFWEDALGIQVDHVEDVSSQKAIVAFLPIGSGEIELVQPTDDESGTAKFLKERGGGMHHICLEVEDIEGMLERLTDRGVRLVNEKPMELEGRKLAFIHPKSANGVLVELYELI